MTKKLFVSKSLRTKKKRSFYVASDLLDRLNEIELRAEKSGVAFPLDEHVEYAISRLVRDAESQLDDLEEVVDEVGTPVEDGGELHASF